MSVNTEIYVFDLDGVITNPSNSQVDEGCFSRDYEMARYFAAAGTVSVFVFVGDKNDTFDETSHVELIRTGAHYAAGTREYFENLSKNK